MQNIIGKGATDEQITRIGQSNRWQSIFILYTDNFERDYNNLIEKDIKIIRAPSKEIYGTVAVFADLYGNFGI